MEKNNRKNKSVIIKIVNVITIIVCVFILIVALISITNTVNGYNNVFGSTILAVETDSMKGDNPDSFDAGDLIVGKLLKDSQKDKLEEGQIITFWTMIDNKRVLNTHRIVNVAQVGDQVTYETKGDNNTVNDREMTPAFEVVAVYKSKISGIGNALLFLQSRNGFLIFVVIPSILTLAYCAYLFFINLKGYNKVKKEEEKEQLKKEFMMEMGQAQQTNVMEAPSADIPEVADEKKEE